uniref:CAP-Gly domain-containing protein n=2 Tax=Macrostomum lignano TaxID=282301 RepID=A0A1I8HRG3_9PLAT
YNQLRAEACYRCCAIIRERCLGSRHRLVAEPLTSLSSALLQTGDGLTRSETEDVLMRALDLVSQGDNNGDSSDSQFIRNLLRFCRTCWSSGTPTNTRPIGQVLANCRRPKTGVASATALPTPPVSSRMMPRRQQSARVLPSQSLQPLVAKSSANSATDIDGDKPMSALLGGKVARQRVQLGGAIDRDIAVGAIAERKYYRGLYVVKTGDPVPGLGRRGADHSQLPGCRVATPVADLNHVLRVEGAAKRLHLVLTSLPASASVSTASASGHKAAWWHCPGRYSTTERPYPPRRSQLVHRLQLRQSAD